MLIVTSPEEISDAYVSYFDGNQWYSILKEDEVSQRTFLLVNQILIIQATTAPPLSLLPTVSVGASR
jgi:hypothetical protein